MALNLDTLGLSATVTAEGISAPDYQTILDTLTSYFQQIYGSDAYLEPDSKDGQMVALVALAIHDANNTAISVYNQDMTIGIWVFPETDISSVSLELIAAIRQGYLTVKAAGVWGGSIEIPSVETPSEGNRFFGFDMDNEYISGFDAGSWGTLL